MSKNFSRQPTVEFFLKGFIPSMFTFKRPMPNASWLGVFSCSKGFQASFVSILKGSREFIPIFRHGCRWKIGRKREKQESFLFRAYKPKNIQHFGFKAILKFIWAPFSVSLRELPSVLTVCGFRE
jgi:hypothetical protein